jgi:hypothetical protein
MKNISLFSLCSLFNHSLCSCVVPETWEDGNVCAIYKKGDTCRPANFNSVAEKRFLLSSNTFITI